MKFKKLLKKTKNAAYMFPMHEAGKFWLGDGTGQLRGTIAENLDRFAAARAAHSWNVLPRLLRAVEERERTLRTWLPAMTPENEAAALAAELELYAAIAAAKEMPDA